MKTNKETLVQELIEITKINLNQVEKFRELSFDALNNKTDESSWSILECIEHLNLYGKYYLPEIENQMIATVYPSQPIFKSGVLGNYFSNLMLPKEKVKKMKTPKDKNPLGSQLGKEVIDTFIQQQQQTLKLLDQARGVDLSKTKTSISISKLIKLRLGDTFRFVINHNTRHLAQARRLLNENELST